MNYSVGRFIGPRVFRAEDTSGTLHKLLNREHLDRAHAFFERHGGMAVVLARFVPIVRTFVPFVAGAGAMTVFGLRRSTTWPVASLWVALCVGAGYAFGNVPSREGQLLARRARDRRGVADPDGWSSVCAPPRVAGAE